MLRPPEEANSRSRSHRQLSLLKETEAASYVFAANREF